MRPAVPRTPYEHEPFVVPVAWCQLRGASVAAEVTTELKE